MSLQSKLELARQSETPESRAVVPLIPPTVDIDIKKIQGDIYPTFPKKYEGFVFFTIKDPAAFRTCLGEFKSLISTSDKVIEILKKIQQVRLANIENETAELANIENQYNIGLSRAAFDLLNIGNIGDSDFWKGSMLQGSRKLGDFPRQDSPGKFIPDWDEYWLGLENPIHGVVVVASQDFESYEAALAQVGKSFKDSIKVNFTLRGKARDGDLKGHEFFGFLDGISQPALRGLVKPHNGQLECNPGVIIHGTQGDPGLANRPPWAFGGSIMAFRQLQQFVYEFDDFLKEHAMPLPGEDVEKGAHRRGARMFGRWKSGCPVDMQEWHDDPAIGGDPEQNNKFTYNDGKDIARCPITAHVRKMAPRSSKFEANLIMRGSIPYGIEKTPEEELAQATLENRGLLFASYQSALGKGFKFIQELWANNVDFPFGTPIDTPGFDPIIGAKEGSVRTRSTKGEDPQNLTGDLTMPRDFIKPRGGEYFWVPGMDAIDMIISNQPMPSVKRS